jgi:hypothetical protein
MAASASTLRRLKALRKKYRLGEFKRSKSSNRKAGRKRRKSSRSYGTSLMKVGL